MKATSSTPSLKALAVAGAVLIGTAAVMFCVLISMPVTAFAAQPAHPGAVSLNIAIFKEVRTQGADGATDIHLVAAQRAMPGDRLVYVLTYRNTGSQPVSNLTLDYPMSKGVAYRAPAEGSQAPLVSTDGVHFGQPGDLAGGSRPEASQKPGDDMVKALRWQVTGPVAPGGEGKVSFKAALN